MSACFGFMSARQTFSVIKCFSIINHFDSMLCQFFILRLWAERATQRSRFWFLDAAAFMVSRGLIFTVPLSGLMLESRRVE